MTALTMLFFGIMFKSLDLKFSATSIAILFNPIFPIHLDREGWLIMDVISLYGMFSFYVMFKELYNDQFPNWEKRLRAPKI